MRRATLIPLFLLALILITPAGIAVAATSVTADGFELAAPKFDRIIREGQTVDEDLVVVGGSLEVQSGATVNGSVSVFGGQTDMAGHVDGDVSIFGGQTVLSGEVDGDLVIFGGTLTAREAAIVDGECILIGGNITNEATEELSCTKVGELPALAIPEALRIPRAPADVPPRQSTFSDGMNFISQVGQIAGQSLFLGLLALGIAAAAPRHLEQVTDTISHKPVVSGAVGLLTGIAGASLIAILAVISSLLLIVCIGLLGFPIVLGLAIILGAGWLMGWIAAGRMVGEWLANVLKMSNPTLAVKAALGTSVLTLAAAILSSLPFLLGGWLWSLAALAVGCTGLGAVALTRFGTRSYPPGAVSAPKVAAVLETLPVEDGEVASESEEEEG